MPKSYNDIMHNFVKGQYEECCSRGKFVFTRDESALGTFTITYDGYSVAQTWLDQETFKRVYLYPPDSYLDSSKLTSLKEEYKKALAFEERPEPLSVACAKNSFVFSVGSFYKYSLNRGNQSYVGQCVLGTCTQLSYYYTSAYREGRVCTAIQSARDAVDVRLATEQEIGEWKNYSIQSKKGVHQTSKNSADDFLEEDLEEDLGSF